MNENENSQRACEPFEAMLEESVDQAGALPPQLEAHLNECAGCRAAFEAARQSQQLLREGLAPAADPGTAFVVRVAAAIRAEEERRVTARSFWKPIEVLAQRLAFTAALALLVLTIFVFHNGWPVRVGQPGASVEAAARFPEPAQPANHDEVLLTLTENNHGR